MEAFFQENNLNYQRTTIENGMAKYQSGPITLYQGDFFQLTSGMMALCEGYFDRAALIALPIEMRQRYVDQMSGLLSKGAKGLLVTMDYPSEQVIGPPFNLKEDEIRRLYATQYEVDKRLQQTTTHMPQMLKKLNITQNVTESVYLLYKK